MPLGVDAAATTAAAAARAAGSTSTTLAPRPPRAALAQDGVRDEGQEVAARLTSTRDLDQDVTAIAAGATVATRAAAGSVAASTTVTARR